MDDEGNNHLEGPIYSKTLQDAKEYSQERVQELEERMDRRREEDYIPNDDPD